jgi:uncharacterized phage-associated protein
MRNKSENALSLAERPALYTAQHVANYFLDRAAAEGRPLTPLKLIKLVYIAYGWMLALMGRKLFDDKIEAWMHGPVIPSLYHEFKHFGKTPVTDRATCVDYFDMDSFEPRIEHDRETLGILDKVWAAYHRFSGWTLREKTHAVGTPWESTYAAGQNAVIEDELIAPHYRKKIGEILDVAES